MLDTFKSIEEYNILIRSAPRGRLIVLDMMATWCNPCMKLAPHFEDMQKEYHNVIFKTVDVDAFPEIADAYQVAALPTVVFVKNGMICDRIFGGNLTSIYETIEKHM